MRSWDQTDASSCFCHTHGPISSSGLALGLVWPHNKLVLVTCWVENNPFSAGFQFGSLSWLLLKQVLKERRMEGSRTSHLYNRLFGWLRVKIKPWYHSRNNCSREPETYLVQICKNPWKFSFFHLWSWSTWIETHCISILVGLLPSQYMEKKTGGKKHH